MSTTQSEHPGDHLKRLLAERGMSQTDLAFILGKGTPKINALTSGRWGISPEMSKALGQALQLAPDYFANLQKEYDLARADDPDPTVTLRASMLQKYPIREMIKRGWIEDGDAENLQLELARFFEVNRTDEIPYLAHAAKKSYYEEEDIAPAQLAWLFRVRQIAKSSVVFSKYTPRSLENALSRMREMLTEPEEARHIPRLLMESGVRFVIVESLPQAKIDGVCFWLDKNSPVIGMSMRYDRIDNFWFVLRHEIEHVLQRHGVGNAVVDDLDGSASGTDNALPEEERIANTAAADFCVPREKMDSFITRKKPFFYEKDVLAFAKLNGIHPGLVVGQIQFRANRYDYLKKYQVKVRQCVFPGAIVDGWGQTVPL